jgi:hypothetical protein
MNPAEMLQGARHASVTSHAPYNRPGESSQLTFQRALAHNPLPVKRIKGGGRKSAKNRGAKSTRKEIVILPEASQPQRDQFLPFLSSLCIFL